MWRLPHVFRGGPYTLTSTVNAYYPNQKWGGAGTARLQPPQSLDPILDCHAGTGTSAPRPALGSVTTEEANHNEKPEAPVMWKVTGDDG